MGQGASISVRKGASIQIGDKVILGGQEFDVQRPPSAIGPAEKEVFTWVSFHFSTTYTPVLPFLKQALEATDQIVTELSSM